jgi:endo-1,4-beta-xylanase
VGFQAHLISGEVGGVAVYKSNLDTFVKLGVEVAYTELDIRMKLPASQQQINQQGSEYYNVVLACATTPKCVGVTTWGLTDKHSWVGGTFPGTGDALPWNSNYQKKPAYYGILYAFGNGTAAYNGSAAAA